MQDGKGEAGGYFMCNAKIGSAEMAFELKNLWKYNQYKKADVCEALI